jgi:glutaminase
MAKKNQSQSQETTVQQAPVVEHLKSSGAASTESAPVAAHPDAVDAREERLFRALDMDRDVHVRRRELETLLQLAGISIDDARLTRSRDALVQAERKRTEEPTDVPLPKAEFCNAIRHDILLIERALQGHMVVPDFQEFCNEIKKLHAVVRENRSGKAANYIPQLDLPWPEVDAFGIALCTVDGQRFTIGEADSPFSIQSTCKPINYCIALEQHGADKVHQHVGREPSGATFNALTLNADGRPHNPMINAGAIMCCSLVDSRPNSDSSGNNDKPAERGWAGRRFEHVLDTWQALAGGVRPGFNNAVFLSERETADRNFALGYFMREKGAFPPGTNLHEVLEFYFQCCSIETTARDMAVVAATLANGGICPVSGNRVFSTQTVQYCLSLMYSCGMYDYSGEFAFKVGLPAKSGVAGALMIVIPNVMGICTWSPRLDRNGNSVRGTDFCDRLVNAFSFHKYDNLTGVSAKRDPRIGRIQAIAGQVTELIWAASKGDLGAVQREYIRGANLNCADYDGRTPLHLAAAEGRIGVVTFFAERARQDKKVDINPCDRWGGTPIDDAVFQGHHDVVEVLRKAGGESRRVIAATDTVPTIDTSGVDPARIVEIIWAASEGDVSEIRRLIARGIPLNVADYDARTPLHLAASEGKLDTVRFLIDQGVPVDPKDRWGHTPLNDATRHQHDDVAQFLGAVTSKP